MNQFIAGDFFELSSDMFCVFGPDGFFRDANQAFCRALGYTKQELLSVPIISLLHPDDVHSTVELLNLSFSAQVVENRYRCADGAFKRLSWKYSVISDPGLILGSAREVNYGEQSKQAVLNAKQNLEIQELYLKLEREVIELLSNSSHQLKHITDHYLKGLGEIYPDMSCAVQLVKGDRLFLLSSCSLPKSYTDYFENGVSIASVPGLEATYFIADIVSAEALVHPYFHFFKNDLMKNQLFTCRFAPVMNECKEVMAAFVAYYKRNREPKEAEIQHVKRISTFLQIVLEAFHTKSNLNWSTERYKFVTLASKDAIYDWDIIADKIHWGEGFERFFGYHEKVNSIDWWQNRIHPEDVDEINDSLVGALECPESNNWNAEYRFRRADNTYAYISEDGFIVRDSSGKAIRMVGAMHDHTKIYEHQYQVLKQNNRLREIAQINSHHIRKPLANILGLIASIKTADSSELQDLVSLLEISGAELDQIIRDIAQKTYF